MVLRRVGRRIDDAVGGEEVDGGGELRGVVVDFLPDLCGRRRRAGVGICGNGIDGRPQCGIAVGAAAQQRVSVTGLRRVARVGRERVDERRLR